MPKSDRHRWAIDGIEEETARVEEDGTRMIVLPRSLLPTGAGEGQVLEMRRAESNGVVTITIAMSADATTAATKRSAAVTNRAVAESKKRDPGGDVSL